MHNVGLNLVFFSLLPPLELRVVVLAMVLLNGVFLKSVRGVER